jgi:hypothetical protein
MLHSRYWGTQKQENKAGKYQISPRVLCVVHVSSSYTQDPLPLILSITPTECISCTQPHATFCYFLHTKYCFLGFFICLFLTVLGFEVRVSYLLDLFSTTWATLSVFFCFSNFSDRVLRFLPGLPSNCDPVDLHFWSS